jgi:hypothetical protein
VRKRIWVTFKQQPSTKAMKEDHVSFSNGWSLKNHDLEVCIMSLTFNEEQILPKDSVREFIQTEAEPCVGNILKSIAPP